MLTALISLSLIYPYVFAATVDVSINVLPPIVDATNLQAIPGNTVVFLTWIKSVSPILDDQILYISNDGGMSYYSSETIGLIESRTVFGLTNGVTYTFKLISVDNTGRHSTPGVTASATPKGNPAPPPPPPPPVCGDGMLEGGEECDDGNTVSGDGCNEFCEIELPVPTEECGNGVPEGLEECDDGNLVDGDGCSSTCTFEQLASYIVQPVPDIVNEPDILLDFTVIDPQSNFDYIKLYYAFDGAPYVQYGGQYRNSPIAMTGLSDAIYDVYSIAVDTGGGNEAAPSEPDATFIIDLIPTLNIKAYPEKRFPAENNWGTPGSLKLYQVGNTSPDYILSATTNNAGILLLDNTIASETYHAAFKGRSHLTKFIRNVTFEENRDVDLDFTFDNAFYLLAGDVHEGKDDYVNALDLSATVIVLYGADDDADLNKDGIVNSLDLSIEVVNLYLSGEEV